MSMPPGLMCDLLESPLLGDSSASDVPLLKQLAGRGIMHIEDEVANMNF